MDIKKIRDIFKAVSNKYCTTQSKDDCKECILSKKQDNNGKIFVCAALTYERILDNEIYKDVIEKRKLE